MAKASAHAESVVWDGPSQADIAKALESSNDCNKVVYTATLASIDAQFRPAARRASPPGRPQSSAPPSQSAGVPSHFITNDGAGHIGSVVSLGDKFTCEDLLHNTGDIGSVLTQGDQADNSRCAPPKSRASTTQPSPAPGPTKASPAPASQPDRPAAVTPAPAAAARPRPDSAVWFDDVTVVGGQAKDGSCRGVAEFAGQFAQVYSSNSTFRQACLTGGTSDHSVVMSTKDTIDNTPRAIPTPKP